MRAVWVEDWTPFENLRLHDVPSPAVNSRQVRIETQAAGVSFATSLVVQGKYQRKPPRPFAPGTESAGIVTEVGADVTRFRPGDRVCAVLDWGGLAEEAAAFEVNTYKIPDAMSFPEAISFTNSYGTSAAALTWPHLLRVEAGDWLLVHGAAGGVGLAAVEIGKILGATVIATAGSDEKLDLARAHGADHAINYRASDFREAALEITGGRGVDAVYDPVGGDVFLQSLRCMAPEGRIMPVGFAGGTIQQIPANILLVKNLTVCGLNMGYYMGWSPTDVRYEYEERMRALMDTMFGWYDAGKIKPVVGGIYPLERFQEAMATVLGRQSQGRVAVVMGQEASRHGLGSGA
jgi:NADPH:quinone reductase